MTIKNTRKFQPKRLFRIFVLKTISVFPPGIILRLLFRLDQWLYFLQGQVAIVYGGGIHTKHSQIRYHDFFVERIEANEMVLDIGCGVGAVTYDIAENAGANVVGIDINPENISLAQKRHAHHQVEYFVGDALQAIPDRSFDVVVLSNILEHLPERSKFLHKVQQIAQPTRMLIRVPLFERDWRVPLKQELGVEWRLDPTHEIEYTIESFAEEMAAAGLEINHQEVRWGEIWAEVEPTWNNDSV